MPYETLHSLYPPLQNALWSRVISNWVKDKKKEHQLEGKTKCVCVSAAPVNSCVALNKLALAEPPLVRLLYGKEGHNNYKMNNSN